MAGYHGITGWSGGGRRPLTYNLMPGQMRSTRVNVFPTVNNFNVYSNYANPYYTDYCDCGCQDSGMPKWLQWTMFGGMFTQLLGGIFSSIWGGGGSEGAGGASKKDADAELDLRQLKTDYKGYTFSRYSDGTVRARDKSGKVVAQGSSPIELRDALDELATKTEVETPKVSHELNKANLEIAVLKDLSLKGKITYDETKGEFVVGDKTFKDLKDAIAEAKKGSTDVSTQQVTTTKAEKVEESAWNEPTKISKLIDNSPNIGDLDIPSDAEVTYGTKNESGIPKDFEIKDKDGNSLYKFVLDPDGATDNGAPKYICTSFNGKPLDANKQQAYFLGSDGKMYQTEDCKGYGTGLGKDVKDVTSANRENATLKATGKKDNKTVSNDSSQRKVGDKGPHGGKVTEILDNGYFWEMLDTDSSGNMRYNYCNKNGYVEKSGIYNKDHKPVSETEYKNKQIVAKHEYSYYSGCYVKKTTRDGKTTYTRYPDNGQPYNIDKYGNRIYSNS